MTPPRETEVTYTSGLGEQVIDLPTHIIEVVFSRKLSRVSPPGLAEVTCASGVGEQSFCLICWTFVFIVLRRKISVMSQPGLMEVTYASGFGDSHN